VFDVLPPEHATFLITEDGAEPHLRRDEYAVVDTTDTELQHGELYVLQLGTYERPRRVIQARSSYVNITGPRARRSLVWWCDDLRGFRKTDETCLGCPVFAGVSDGPYLTEDLKSKLVGRIVGVAFSALCNLLAPTAGWKDEQAGNAAFDPTEYIDTLLAAGHRPSMCGELYYEETPHRRITKLHDDAVTAVRWKFVKASTALERVKAECRQRGLVDRGRHV